jgi:hypothetical protein
MRGFIRSNMWNVVPSDRWNWLAIREVMSQFGLRNSSRGPYTHYFCFHLLREQRKKENAC